MHEDQLPFSACTRFLGTTAHSGRVEKIEKGRNGGKKFWKIKNKIDEKTC